MNRFIPILATPLVMFSRFDHPQGLEHRDPSEETSDCHSVSFVERGGFALRAKRREWRLEAGMVLEVETPYYEPGFGGIQVEDTVLVTATGYEMLTSRDRELVRVA